MTVEESKFRSRLAAMNRAELERTARAKDVSFHPLNTTREIIHFLWRKYERETLQRR